RHLLAGHLGILADVRVHLFLDAPQGRVGDRRRLAEVEAQAVGRDQRPRLAHLLAELPAQHGVQNVCDRVIEADRLAPFAIHFQAGGLSAAERAAHDGTDVDGEVGARLERIGDLDQRAVSGLDHAAVADLAARFTVEGRLGSHDVSRLATAHLVTLFAVDREPGDGRFRLVCTFADEPRRPCPAADDAFTAGFARFA